jgi:iron complex outermembrane recepter protein
MNTNHKSKIKPFIIWLFLLVIRISTYAQSISGIITDEKSDKTLPGVNISIKSTTGATSDAEGKYIISNIKTGDYILKVSCVGYENIIKHIVIKENENLKLDFILTPSLIMMNEVVITSTKTENLVKDVPQRIELVTAKQIEFMPANTIDDLLAYTTMVNISRPFGVISSKATVTMRGLSGKEQARTLVLMDGIPVNKSDGGTVNWNLYDIDNVERIEVIKGPGSSLYGGNAMGGVINIISKKPVEKFAGNIGFEGGTYNTFAGHLNLNGKQTLVNKNNFYWGLNGQYLQSDGYITQNEIDKTAYTVKSNSQIYGSVLKTGYDFGKNNIELNASYFVDKMGTGEVVYQEEGNITEHDTYQFMAKYKGERKTTKWIVSGYYLYEDYIKVNEYIKENLYTLYDVASKRIDLGLLSTITQKLGNYNTVTSGIDVKHGSVDAYDMYYTSTDKVDNAGKMNTYAVFLQDEINFMKKFKIVAGVRYDYATFYDGLFEIENPSSAMSFMSIYNRPRMENKSWSALSPKISGQYKITNDLRTYVSYSKGFRPSVLDDLCRSGRVKGGFKIANPALKPEYVDNYELGTDITLFNKLYVSLTGYYSLGEDFMYYVSTGEKVDMGAGEKPVFVRENISKVEIYGLEAEANYEITSNITLFGNYAYTHSQIKDHIVQNPLIDSNLTKKYLTDVPTNSAAAGLSWKNRIVNISLFYRYTGEIWINDYNVKDDIYFNTSKYPSYYTIDAKLSKEIRNIMLGLSIQNITDQKYYDSKMAVCPGRFIMGKIGYKF